MASGGAVAAWVVDVIKVRGPCEDVTSVVGVSDLLQMSLCIRQLIHRRDLTAARSAKKNYLIAYRGDI